MSKSSNGIEVTTRASRDGVIDQEVRHRGNQIMRKVLNTQEAQVRAQLIGLGWVAPDQVAERDAAVREATVEAVREHLNMACCDASVLNLVEQLLEGK